MADKLVIYLGQNSHTVQWAVLSASTHNVLDEGQGTLAQAAEKAQGRSAVVLIPSDEVLLKEVAVPSRNVSKVRMAVPNLLEESLSDDIDDLHYAIGKQGKGDLYPVVIIAKQRIEQYQQRLSDAGVRVEHLMPSVLALPYADNRWSVLQEGDEVIVRASEYSGFSCAPENMPLFLKQALNDVSNADKPTIEVYQDEMTIPEMLDVQVDRRQARSLMQLLAKGLDQGLVINLLQGDYKPLRKTSRFWKQWTPTAVLMTAMLVLWFGLATQETYSLKQKNTQLKQEIENVYTETFPGSRVVNPRAQMKNKLAQLKKAGSTNVQGFLSQLGSVSLKLKQSPDTVLKGINYRKGNLDLDVQVKDLKSLEDLRGQFSNSGLTSEVLTAKSEQGVVNGRIRIQ